MPRKNSKARSPKKPMSVEAKRREQAVKRFQSYVNTYVNTFGTPDRIQHLSMDTILEDFLYGLGTILDYQEYNGPDGYRRFKKYLSEKLMMEMLRGR